MGKALAEEMRAEQLRNHMISPAARMNQSVRDTADSW
jgi:hypothetical protein